MTTESFDLFVIGAGSGGVRAARIAAAHGARVAIAEEYRFGGTCVIRGCVPKKLLVYASRFPDAFSDARGFGWSVPQTSFDWPTLIAAKDKELAQLEGVYRDVLDRHGVAIFEERAEVTGPHSVRLKASGKTIEAKTILVATGGTPNGDDGLEGHAHTITSNEVFHLESQPKHIVIVGGGYIAVEFASIFAGLGSAVTLAYRGDQILRGFDDDLRSGLSEALTARGVNILTKTTFDRIEKTDGGLVAHVKGGSAIKADQIMMAIGRTPNTDGLGLESAGVELSRSGAVVVNDHSQSSVPSIYAVGDVTDRVQLTPVAIREGHAFADSVFARRGDAEPWTVDYDTIPTAVFTTPEIGTVGLAEHEARAATKTVVVYTSSFRTMKATIGGSDERMTMKMIVDGDNDRVLGVHVLGPDAAEIVQMAAVALRMKATKHDFDSTMALHPSSGEELMTLRTPRPAPAG